jgi:uncharacterized protein (TIGR03435 family)
MQNKRMVALGLAAAGSLLAAFATEVPAYAQSSQRSEFEVASVKPSTPANPRASFEVGPGGTFSATNTTARALIRFAYRVLDVQISGGPSWINTDNYDIIAKPGVESSPEQVRQMMQALLADRFKLTFHRETRSLRAYALVLGKNGPKLSESAGAEGGIRGERGQTPNATRIVAKGVSFQLLSTMLPSLLGYPVLDMTGLPGNYDFQLEWTPFQPPPRSSGEEGPPPDLSGTSIFAALQEQLGLKLEARKEPVEMFIIEGAEKATGN